MIRVLVILAFAYRLRRVRRLMAAGNPREAERVLAAIEREHRVPRQQGGA